MESAYPTVITEIETGYLVFVPDFDINTQGKSIPDAIFMARDTIGLMGIDMEDDGETIPEPSPISRVSSSPSDIVTLVDINFAEYRRKEDNRTVRKNLTIPSWLNVEAEKAGINFSQILQNALKEQLNIQP